MSDLYFVTHIVSKFHEVPTVCKAFKEIGLRNRSSVQWSLDLFVFFP